MSYFEALKIDRYNLEYELARQPQLYMEWALFAVDGTVDREMAKTDLELIKGQIDERVRNNPQKYGIPEGKVSESAIKFAVLRHSKVKRYFKKYIKTLKNEKTLNEAKVAFAHRKKMLEALVQLNVQLHFAEPKIPTTTKEMLYQSTKTDVLKQMKKKKIKRRQ